MDKVLNFIITVVFALMIGGIVYSVAIALIPDKPEPMPTSATIRCPFPNEFSFVRNNENTITVHCIQEPLEVPKVEVHAASTPAFAL